MHPLRALTLLMSLNLVATVVATVLATLAVTGPAYAFCGFYVAKADTALFNRASKVVVVRDGDRTGMTMANDFRGDPQEFAIVIPVPTFIEREQIHIADRALIDHLDAYSAPRLVEYHLELRPEALGRLRQQIVEVLLDEFLPGLLSRLCDFDHRVRLGDRI